MSRWSARGLLRAHDLHGQHLRPDRENAAPAVRIDTLPSLVCDGEDVVPVSARSVEQ